MLLQNRKGKISRPELEPLEEVANKQRREIDGEGDAAKDREVTTPGGHSLVRKKQIDNRNNQC